MDDKLLINFIEHTCSQEEAKTVLRWIEADKKNRDYYTKLQSLFASMEINDFIENNSADQLEVRAIIKKASKQRNSHINTYLIAAASVAAVILMLLLIPFVKENEESIYEKALAGIVHQDEITLTVQNSKKIELRDSSVVVAHNRTGQILINDSITIDESIKKQTELNTIYVPYGKRSTMILADGTKVFINSGSSLIYPSSFKENIREVYLDGEAYFEVAKETDRRFVVKTLYKDIEVLGTKFNVSVDRKTENFETVLVSGKIGVESQHGKIELSPNQCYTYSSQNTHEELKTVDARSYISWIKGRLIFNKESMLSVIRKLEKAYNIEIEIKDKKYLIYQITGSLNLKNTPEETMNNLIRILIPDTENHNKQLYFIKTKENYEKQ